MRTSNKILLISFLSAIGIFCAVHMALYAKFRKGEIITGKDPKSAVFTFYSGPVPSILLLNGNLNVTIIPSDSFAIEWEKDIDGKINLRSAGDSLIVAGSQKVSIDPFNEGARLQSLGLTVYCGHLPHLRLSGCVARIDGTLVPAPFAVDLRLLDAQLRFGGYFEYNGNVGAGAIREFYDSIRIDAAHSNILIQQNATIRSLYVQLADRSRIQDNEAPIEKPEIHYSDDSRLDLSGENLRKLK